MSRAGKSDRAPLRAGALVARSSRSPATRSSTCWARARWGSSTRRGRRASTGSSRSRCCSIPWPRTRSSSSGSSARPRSPPSSRTTTSSTRSMPARSDGQHYFVMEYVEGLDDQGLTSTRTRSSRRRRRIRIVLAVAEALKHAHQRGLIHRDIKPENVILTKDGGVKLADLGLARLTADEKWAMSEAGMAIGTPYYISPEQVRGQVDIDIRADIYSLGATLYHMVTGRVPYGGDDPDRGHAEARRQERPARAARPPQHQALQRSGHGRRDDDGQEPGESLPQPRRPDPRPQVPAPGRKPDDRRPEARDASRRSPRARPRRTTRC